MKKGMKSSAKDSEYLHIKISPAIKDALRVEAKKQKRTLQGQVQLIFEKYYHIANV